MNFFTKEYLTEVFLDTYKQMRQRREEFESLEMVKKSDSFTDEDILFEKRNYNTIIKVVPGDSLDVAKELGNAAILNMASFKNPGGGVTYGCHAQEECICRRTNLMEALRTFYYPLPTISTIYTPNVTVFKDVNYNNCDIWKCSILSSAMIKNPVTINGHFTNNDRIIAKSKIENLLKTALYFNERRLVLSAWGCGAYKCPTADIAEIFNECLKEDTFKNQFEIVYFAILNEYSENYKTFNRIINT